MRSKQASQDQSPHKPSKERKTIRHRMVSLLVVLFLHRSGQRSRHGIG